MFAALLLPLLLQAAPLTADRVESTFHVRTYSIHGGSARELWEQIQHLGPVDVKDGKHDAAYTTWKVDWH